MDFQLLKEIKTKGLFMKMFFTLVFGLLIMVALKFCKIRITDSFIEIFSLVITLIWFLLVLKFMKKNNISVNNFISKPSRKTFILEVPITFIVTYLGGIGLILLMLVLVNYINPNILKSLLSNISDKPHELNTIFITIISFLGTVVVAPVAEEFIFRGILMNRLYNKYGIGKSIIFSSLIFLIAHLTPNPILLFLGMSCSILVYKYKSLVPAILLHGLNNLIAFIRNLNSNANMENNLSVNSSFVALGIILFIIYVAYVYINYRKYKI